MVCTIRVVLCCTVRTAGIYSIVNTDVPQVFSCVNNSSVPTNDLLKSHQYVKTPT